MSQLLQHQVCPGATRQRASETRSTLQQDWTQYSSIQRSRCTGLVATGGPPSYVELLTCLEMAKHANQVGEKSKTETVGRH